MINLKKEMLRTATSYLNIDSNVKNWLVDYYNANCIQYVSNKRKYKMKYTDSWCAMFMSVVAHKVGMLDFPFEVSVEQMLKLSKLDDAYFTKFSDLEIGDLVIYNWDGNYINDHIGIVHTINYDCIVVLEGNYKSTVGLRVVSNKSPVISGFIKL